MKKITLFFAFCLLSVVVQAATFSWGTAGAYSSVDTWTPAQGKMWLVALGSTSATELRVNTAGTLLMADGAAIRATSEQMDATAGKSASFAGFTSADLGYYALVFMDTTTNTFGVSDALEVTEAMFSGGTLDEDTTLGSAEFKNGSDEYGDYLLVDRALVTDVPEPTVLALLALGVAGLALKRKHF